MAINNTKCRLFYRSAFVYVGISIIHVHSTVSTADHLLIIVHNAVVSKQLIVEAALLAAVSNMCNLAIVLLINSNEHAKSILC